MIEDVEHRVDLLPVLVGKDDNVVGVEADTELDLPPMKWGEDVGLGCRLDRGADAGA